MIVDVSAMVKNSDKKNRRIRRENKRVIWFFKKRFFKLSKFIKSFL